MEDLPEPWPNASGNDLGNVCFVLEAFQIRQNAQDDR